MESFLEPKGEKHHRALSVERPNIPVWPTDLVYACCSSIIINSAPPPCQKYLGLIDESSGRVNCRISQGTQIISHEPSSAASSCSLVGFRSLSALSLCLPPRASSVPWERVLYQKHGCKVLPDAGDGGGGAIPREKRSQKGRESGTRSSTMCWLLPTRRPYFLPFSFPCVFPFHRSCFNQALLVGWNWLMGDWACTAMGNGECWLQLPAGLLP